MRGERTLFYAHLRLTKRSGFDGAGREMHKGLVKKKTLLNALIILKNFFATSLMLASVRYKWSAQQFKASDGIPFIGLSTAH
jgi:hypothetical protein